MPQATTREVASRTARLHSCPMPIPNPSLSTITEADLKVLIAVSAREDRTLDFKRDAYEGNADARAEFLADISALTNTPRRRLGASPRPCRASLPAWTSIKKSCACPRWPKPGCSPAFPDWRCARCRRRRGPCRRREGRAQLPAPAPGRIQEPEPLLGAIIRARVALQGDGDKEVAPGPLPGRLASRTPGNSAEVGTPPEFKTQVIDLKNEQN